MPWRSSFASAGTRGWSSFYGFAARRAGGSAWCPLLADAGLRVTVRIAKFGTNWHCRSRKRVTLQKRFETAFLEKQNSPSEQNLTIMLTAACISAYLRRSIGDLK